MSGGHNFRPVPIAIPISRTVGSHLSHETLKHLKSLLSGIFAHAKRQGFFDGVNPVMDTAIPPSPKGGDTYAYSLEEITPMLMVLPEPAVSIVATAEFTGARRGEIRGMLWENYRHGAIYVNHSVWESHVTEPKTKASRAPGSCNRTSGAFLWKQRERLGNPSSGVMCPAVNRKPLSLNNVLNRQIRVALERCVVCREGKRKHGPEVGHKFKLDETRPQ